MPADVLGAEALEPVSVVFGRLSLCSELTPETQAQSDEKTAKIVLLCVDVSNQVMSVMRKVNFKLPCRLESPTSASKTSPAWSDSEFNSFLLWVSIGNAITARVSLCVANFRRNDGKKNGRHGGWEVDVEVDVHHSNLC